MPTPLVVDLYHGDQTPDFTALYDAGILGVIHKASEGADFVDPAYSRRRHAAEDAGLLWGAYHFLRPGGDMAQQAAFFVAAAAPDADTLLVADHEDSGVSLADLKSFLAAVVAAVPGASPVLYSGSVIKEQLGPASDPELAAYRLWVAEYCSPPPNWPTATWAEWWLWQYTDTGQIDGCQGSTDLSSYSSTPENLIADWTTIAPAPAPSPSVLVAFEVPSGIALKITVNGSEIAL
jgi:GH25 family lysozyme M1 (1,4-beta-N-acetylmuramidase)